MKKYVRTNSPTGYECSFAYTVGGVKYEIYSVRAYIPHSEGEPVNVLYNPADPADAHVEGFFTDPDDGKKAAYVFIAAGVAAAAAGAAISAVTSFIGK